MAAMRADGYMLHVEYDGDTLTAEGTNKAAHVALAGPDHAAGPVRIARADMTEVTFTDANPVKNGAVTIRTTAGRKYVLHFRRKQRDAFRELYAALTG